MKTRTEKDSLGTLEIPYHVLYGIQTQRAFNNFQIIEDKVHPQMIASLAIVKKACALGNLDVKSLDDTKVKLITDVCDEILDGQHRDHFITRAIQGGAGTSINMNMNEVISNRVSQMMNQPLGMYDIVHPNDHANKAQSTNDVIPTAGKLTTLVLCETLLEAMNDLADAFKEKKEAFEHIIKVGRTHLQDAVLISMGQVFGSYETFVRRDINRLNLALNELLEINLGGTAVGTKINTEKGYQEATLKHFNALTQRQFVSAKDLVDNTKHLDTFGFIHSILKGFALSLSRLNNDLRLMASGPRAGLSEIILPEMQPGSSIMPGKVNPVILEVINQSAFQVIGNDVTVSMAVEAGQMELNVFEPVLFYNLFQSLEVLTNACNTLSEKAIKGLNVNEAKCNEDVEKSLAKATALVKVLGYGVVSDLAKQALSENKSLKAVVLEAKLLDEEVLDKYLDPTAMV